MLRKLARTLCAIFLLGLGVSPVFAQTVSGGGGGGGVLAGDAPLGWRPAATGGVYPTYWDSGVPAFLCAKSHVSGAEPLYSVSLRYDNSYLNTSGGFAETGSGSTATFQAWVEYPTGTYTRQLFSGASSLAIASGDRAYTDQGNLLPVVIPPGTPFRTWTSVVGVSAGRVLQQAGTISSAENGREGCLSSAITTSSVPGTAAFGSTALSATTVYGPTAVLAQTTHRAVGIVGDSIEFGIGSYREGGRGDVGVIAQALGVNKPYPMPYIKYAASGHGHASFVALSGAQRSDFIELMNLTTDVIDEWGANDKTSNLATFQANTATTKGLLNSSVRYWLTTKFPIASSTNGWIDLAGQTSDANISNLQGFSGWARGYPSGYAGYFELADACESSRNSGKWKFTGSLGSNAWTTDGTHPTQLCYAFLRDSGYIQMGN